MTIKKKERECNHIWKFIKKGTYLLNPEIDNKDECELCGKVRKHKHDYHRVCDKCGDGYD